MPSIPDASLFLGELSLDGGVRHTNGILPMVAVAKQEGYDTVFVPAADADEAALVDGVTVIAVERLAQLVAHLRGDELIEPRVGDPSGRRGTASGPVSAAASGGVDLADIRGQEHAKRALEVAAAGGHNLLMTGPPAAARRCWRDRCHRCCRSSPIRRRWRSRRYTASEGCCPRRRR